VLFTDEPGIADLNKRFRGLEEPTDVLTFPEGQAASGDIAICVPYAKRQARERGIELQDEIVFLAVHGALHLVGLNDESDDERAEMIRRMNQIVVRLGMAPDNDWGSLLHEVAS
jgi:rRNA maturation RNase YbeY